MGYHAELVPVGEPLGGRHRQPARPPSNRASSSPATPSSGSTDFRALPSTDPAPAVRFFPSPRSVLASRLIPVSSRGNSMSASIRYGVLSVLAGCGTASSVQAQDAQPQASAPQEEIEEVVVTGLSRQPECGARRQARVGGRDRQHSRRGHRQVSRLEPRRIAAAHSRRVDRARRRRRPQHLACAAWARSSRACASTAWRR